MPIKSAISARIMIGRITGITGVRDDRVML